MDIFKEVKKLKLPKGKYLIFGSGPLQVHGIRDTRDIDILALPEIRQFFIDKGFKEKVFPSGLVNLVKGLYEVGFDWNYGTYHPDTKYLIDTAEIINGVPFARLEEVLKWKRAFGREKDLKDVTLIENYLSKTK